MTKDKCCKICGKKTRKVLFEAAQTKIYICSKKCENEYFKSLHGYDKERQEALHFFDQKIAKVKKYDLYSWIIALLGVIIMLVSVFLVNLPPKNAQIGVPLFLIGVIPLTGSLFFTSHLSKVKQKLMEKREQLVRAYSG